MPSQYLLEAGTDQYLLEDSSGLLQLEGTGYRATILADNPTAYWRLGEPAGPTLWDEVGTAHGTYVGGPTLGVAGALSGDPNTGVKLLRASSQWARVRHSSAVSFANGPCSYEVWVKKTTGVQAFNNAFLCKGDNTPSMGMDLTTGKVHWFSFNSSLITSSGTFGITDTRWHHLVGTMDTGGASGIWKLYIDGVDRTSFEAVPTSQSTTTTDLFIGVWSDLTTNADASLDEIALYNYVLTPGQVMAHYRAAGAYRAEVYADSPVAYWRLGEKSGSTAVDELGVSNGTYLNTPVLGQPGLIDDDDDTSVSFDGISAGTYISVPDSATLDLGDGPFSLECWAKMDTTGRAEPIFDKGAGGAYQMSFDGNATNKLQLIKTGVATIARTSVGTADNNPHHFVITKNGASTFVYKDGVDVTEMVGNQTLANNAVALEIGRISGGGNEFDGWLDELAIYKSVLTPARVLQHYLAGVDQYRAVIMTDSPTGYWRLDEQWGVTAIDEVGSNNGTYHGDPRLDVIGATQNAQDGAMAITAATQNMGTGQTIPTAAVSLEVWTRGSFNNNDSAFIGQWSTTGAVLYYNKSAPLVSLFINAGSVAWASSVISDGKWHHLVGTWDGANGSLYHNGILVAGPTALSGPITPAGSFFMGTYGDGTGHQSFDGMLDEGVVYDYALTAAQVATHYRTGRPYRSIVLNDGPAAYWRCDEPS